MLGTHKRVFLKANNINIALKQQVPNHLLVICTRNARVKHGGGSGIADLNKKSCKHTQFQTF